MRKSISKKSAVRAAFLVVSALLGVALHSIYFSTIRETNRAPANESYSRSQELKTNVTRLYKLKREIELKNDAGTLISQVSLSGTLLLTTLPAKNQNERLFLVKALLENQSIKDPALVTLDEQFDLKEIRLTRESTGDERNFYRDIASILAFRHLEDTSGQYEATFFNVNPATIKKQKTNYLSSPLTLDESSHKWTWDSTATYPLSIEGFDQTHTEPSEGVQYFGLSKYSITFISENTSDKITELKDNQFSPVSLALQETSEPIDNSNSSYLSLKDLLPELSRYKDLPRRERLKLFHSLIALLEKDKSSLTDFKNHIESSADSEIKTLAIGVLATLGTEAAQDILIDWYHAKNKEQNSLESHLILNSLVTTSANILPKTEKFLLEVSDSNQSELSENARLALGSALRAGDHPNAFLHLLKKAENPTNQKDLGLTLDSIGNSGDTRFVEPLLRIYNENGPSVQSRVILAARLINDSRINELFERAIQSGNNELKQAVTRARALVSP